LRQFINEIQEFEPFAAFTRFDRREKKILDAGDLKKFLEDNHQISTEKNKLLIKFFLEFYDFSNQGGVTFDE
jgi:hypothetical protein